MRLLWVSCCWFIAGVHLAACRVLPSWHHSNWLKGAGEDIKEAAGVVDWYNERVPDSRTEEVVSGLQGGWVRYLSIGSCTVSTEALSQLLAASLYNATQLSFLSLRHCHVDAQVLSLAMSSRPAEQNNSSNDCLRVLDLSFNSCLDGRAVKLLASAIAQCTGLTTVALDGNALQPDDVRAIVHALRRHPTVTSLSLSSCGLDDACAEYLAFLLKSNRNITSLDLSCNGLTQRGLEMLAGAVRAGAGRGLRGLDLSYNALGDLGALTMASAFECNQLGSLQYLSLRETHAGSAALATLLSSIHASQLECLDISGNTLFAPEARPKAAKGAKKMRDLAVKSLEQLGSSLAPAVSQAVQSGRKMFLDLGAAVTEAVEGGGSKRKGGRLQIGYNKAGGAKRGMKGGAKRKAVAKGAKKAAKRAAKGTNTKRGKGAKADKEGGREAAKRASKADPTSLLKKHQKKLLTRSRSRALAALLGAARSSPTLKVLGLVSTGLTNEAGAMLRALAGRANANANATVTATASANSTSSNSSAAPNIPNESRVAPPLGLPPLQVLLELNGLSAYAEAQIRGALIAERLGYDV